MKKIIAFLLISICTASCAENSLTNSSVNSIVIQKALNSGIVFTSNQVQYQLILGGRATSNNVNSTSALSSSSTVNNSNVWSGQKGPYQLSIAGPLASGTNSMSASSEGYNLIAFNSESGNIGIIVGEIIVKLKSGVTAESIASSYGINLTNNFESIRTAVYRVYSWQNIFTIAQQLSLDQGIEFAELDVIEHIPQPM
jgi:hypothetical protein